MESVNSADSVIHYESDDEEWKLRMREASVGRDDRKTGSNKKSLNPPRPPNDHKSFGHPLLIWTAESVLSCPVGLSPIRLVKIVLARRRGGFSIGKP